MSIPYSLPILLVTTLYQLVACYREQSQPPPGQLIDLGSHRLHMYSVGTGKPTIVLDHSLGGLEGYLLIEKLSQLGRVVICDRAGYGWSEHNPNPRSSQQIVNKLHQLLIKGSDWVPIQNGSPYRCRHTRGVDWDMNTVATGKLPYNQRRNRF